VFNLTPCRWTAASGFPLICFIAIVRITLFFIPVTINYSKNKYICQVLEIIFLKLIVGKDCAAWSAAVIPFSEIDEF